MDPLLIVIIVLLVITIALGIVLLVLIMKKKEGGSSKELNQELGSLKEKMDQIPNKVLEPLNYQVIQSLQKSINDGLWETNEKIKKSIDETNDKNAKAVEQLTNEVNKKLSEINANVNEKLHSGFSETNETFNKITEKMAQLTQVATTMDSLNKEVVELSKVFNSSQTRGRYGEIALDAILNTVFGENDSLYSVQYSFRDTNNKEVRPDAVIKLPAPDNLLCIDSKFPEIGELLDCSEEDPNYSSLLSEFINKCKSVINDISDKYIISGMTANQAMMFIPSDAIFTFVHSKAYDKVVQYAQKKNVIIVSPSTLQPVLYTIRALHLNYARTKNIQSILSMLNDLMKEFKDFEDRWLDYDKALNTLVNDKTNKINIKFKKISNKYKKLENQTSGSDEETPVIEDEEQLV